MKNLIPYENHSNPGVSESYDQMEESGCMTPASKMALEKLCEELLCKEARDYHDDENPEHTYESYVNECMNRMNELMGSSGYSPLGKPHAK
jgi:hypothetical protein